MSNVVGSIDILLAREASGAADKSPDETKAIEMLGYAHADDQRRSQPFKLLPERLRASLPPNKDHNKSPVCEPAEVAGTQKGPATEHSRDDSMEDDDYELYCEDAADY